MQVLVFSGQILDDASSVMEYGITEEATIDLRSRLVGAGLKLILFPQLLASDWPWRTLCVPSKPSCACAHAGHSAQTTGLPTQSTGPSQPSAHHAGLPEQEVLRRAAIASQGYVGIEVVLMKN